ncbi:MmgE/PrpD family protein [Pseudocolwellia agarivorans]|uniref:MmgE/PrpD family protein n=1 Tax=Pseudocolwellia agarivorans TaxID=1911682 RepID=UPI0009861C50|nr:MmgE/PrpD family protein [Pseudocolwellia agarivorans]
MTAIETLLQHIEQTTFENLPDSSVNAVKTFVLDSIGVGISGSRVLTTQHVKKAVATWGEAKQAQVWSTGEWLPANAAAVVNGFQIHNQEWDCVHEPAVVHPMAVILSALMAFGQRENITGKQLILGITVAVDVATLIGASATGAMKFFRPSICGCLGATAGLAAIKNIKGDTLKNALGIAYSQISGTMQAHVEGSPMLPMQIGINSANAINAFDMAMAGLQGPKDILEGPFGYFNLFEDSYDLTYFNENIGKQYQIECVSHKPYPTGRAGHGGIDGLLTLQAEHKFSAEDVKHVVIRATPLIHRLVGRPANNNMDVSYAKLCNGYIAATALITGNVTVEDFEPHLLTDSNRLALAQKVTTELNSCKDLNALAPVSVEVTLHNGKTHHIELAAVLGNPARPLSKKAQITKFTAACSSAKHPLDQQQIQQLIVEIDHLGDINNINDLVSLTLNNH